MKPETIGHDLLVGGMLVLAMVILVWLPHDHWWSCTTSLSLLPCIDLWVGQASVKMGGTGGMSKIVQYFPGWVWRFWKLVRMYPLPAVWTCHPLVPFGYSPTYCQGLSRWHWKLRTAAWYRLNAIFSWNGFLSTLDRGLWNLKAKKCHTDLLT